MSLFSYHKQYSSDRLRWQLPDSRVIGRLVSYLYPYRSWVFAILGILIFAKGLESFVPVLLGRTIQYVIDASSYGLPFEQAMNKTLGACILTASVLLLNYVLDVVNVLMKNGLGQRVISKLRSDVFETVQFQGMAFHDKTPVGRLMSRTLHDVESIGRAFSDSVVQIVGNILLLVAMIVGGLIVQWQVTSMILLTSPLIYIMTQSFRRAQRRCYQFLRAVNSAMTSYLQEQIAGAFTIRQYLLQEPSQSEFSQINEDHCHAQLEGTHHFSFFMAGLDLGQSLILIVTFVTLVLVTPEGSAFQGGTYFIFSIYVLMFFRPLRDVAERYNVLQEALAGAERVFEIIDARDTAEDPDVGEELKSVDTLEFKDVYFAYDPEHWVLKGVSFFLRKGEVIALVGISGSGKTTITRLLNRFYDIQKGQIFINGKEIRSYSLKSLRRHFGTVQQEPLLFSGTIAENLSLFSPKISESVIEGAVKDVRLEGVMARSSRGIHEQLSALQLSTGEQQLLALGRALASQSDVIVLDEATANVDTETEHRLQETLGEILEGSTALVIAHRLSTIQRASRILVLHRGQIVEEGTHSALLEAGGVYEKLYRYQYK